MANQSTPFDLTNEHLAQLCAINRFAVPVNGVIFFGLRGLLPEDPRDHEFRGSQRLAIAKVDYVHPRCTLGQWNRTEGVLAVFPASTVPALHLFRKKIVDNGRGANQLMTGYYRHGYLQGVHKRGAPTGHEAFRQQGTVPVRRTADDEDYDVDDRVEFGSPMDNLHAAWVSSVTAEKYSSLGCQVVVGKPDSDRHRGNSGPWKAFKEFAYGITQKQFPYVLLQGRDAQRIASNASEKELTRLRFGSSGELVTAVQEALKKSGHDLDVDGKFGNGTLTELMEFQLTEVGPRSDDGIVGPRTAEALGLLDIWPGKRSSRRPHKSQESESAAVTDWPTVPIGQRRVHLMELLTTRYEYPVEAAAGIVGNLEIESGVIPSRLEGSSPKEPMRAPDLQGNTRTWSPEEIMNRIPREQGPRLAGVGLAQWTAKNRRRRLFEHRFEGAQPGAAIVFNMEAQVDYLVHELKMRFGTLDSLLRKRSVTVDEAAAEVVYDFERPGSVLKKVDGKVQRRSRDDPKVQKVFTERQKPAHAALADFREAHP